MPIEQFALLILLLAAGIAAGWWLRSHFGGATHGAARNFHADYYRGLNHLLNEQPDKALEVFLRMVEVDKDTVETHFALGSLFRQRGEFERAIRIHQNIIARPNLPAQQREDATLALGEDYHGAGLYDRAEEIFTDLARVSRHRVAALSRLSTIFEQQKDWEQAIATQQRLVQQDDAYRGVALAHYHCELAQASLAGGDVEAADGHLKAARQQRPTSARCDLMAGDMAAEAGNAGQAMAHYARALEAAEWLAPEVMPRLTALNTDLPVGKALAGAARHNPRLREQVARAAAIQGYLLDTEITAWIREWLDRNGALNELLKAVSGPGSAAADNAALRRVLAVLGGFWRGGARYLCQQCGYASVSLNWQCPGCKKWETARVAPALPAGSPGAGDALQQAV